MGGGVWVGAVGRLGFCSWRGEEGGDVGVALEPVTRGQYKVFCNTQNMTLSALTFSSL